MLKKQERKQVKINFDNILFNAVYLIYYNFNVINILKIEILYFLY